MIHQDRIKLTDKQYSIVLENIRVTKVHWERIFEAHDRKKAKKK